MTRAGTIPPSDIARIQVYAKKRRNTKAGLKQVLKETGGDIVMNGPVFLKGYKPCCHLKADGKVLCQPAYSVWGISWNGPEDFGMKVLPNSDANHVECVQMIESGRSIMKPSHNPDMVGKRPRTVVGTKEGRLAYYASNSGLTHEALLDVLLTAGWDSAVLMDGGGSTCIYFKDGSGFAGDGRYIPFWLVIHLKHDDAKEPQGGKPMVEVNAYSKKKDGNKKLSEHFKVKEFACKDGSDPIFVSAELVEVMEKIRVHFGKPVIVTSGYRTPVYNSRKEVGGVAYSQHVYGTAADIKITGVTPKEIADYAEKLLPKSGGIGLYKTFVHIDVRKTKSRWNG